MLFLPAHPLRPFRVFYSTPFPRSLPQILVYLIALAADDAGGAMK